jgi:hypothetical protein
MLPKPALEPSALSVYEWFVLYNDYQASGVNRPLEWRRFG